jgi:hypothetical protein
MKIIPYLASLLTFDLINLIPLRSYHKFDLDSCGHGGSRYFPPGLTFAQVSDKYPDAMITQRTLRFPGSEKKLIWLVHQDGRRFQVTRQH